MEPFTPTKVQMDMFGEILDFGTPVPFPPLPAQTSDAERFGNSIAPIRAVTMGFRAISTLKDGAIRKDKDIRMKNAKLWQFRYNTLEAAAYRACSDLSVDSKSFEFDKHIREYKQWRKAWQAKAYGHAAGVTEPNWFPKFVEAAVSQYNYEAHVFNLKRLFWEKNFVPADETNQARASRTNLRDRAGARVQQVRQELPTSLGTVVKINEKTLESISTKSSKGQREHGALSSYIEELRQVHQKAIAFDPLPNEPGNNTQIPPPKLYYHEKPGDSYPDFWGQFWTKEVARHIYRWAHDVVLVDKNFDDDKIGAFMETTFINMCDWTWTYVLAPRRENKRAAANPMPYIRQAAIIPEDSQKVYQRFKSMASRYDSLHNIGTIEDIWVAGAFGKQRKAPKESAFEIIKAPKRRRDGSGIGLP